MLDSNLKEEDIPPFKPLEWGHYREQQLNFYNTRKYFRGIDEKREVTSMDMNTDFPIIERNFRKWYQEEVSKMVELLPKKERTEIIL